MIIGIKDLGPEGGTLNEKFKKNFFVGENLEARNTVALRIARVNHACQPNANTVYDETAHVAILFALKDIQPGEEICICYYASFFMLVPMKHSTVMSVEEEFNFYKKVLASDYGITCSTNCYCQDPTILTLVKEGRHLYATTDALATQLKTEEALAAGEKLLGIYRRLNVSWVYRGLTDVLVFHVAVQKSEFLPKAMLHIRSAVDLFRKICPYSEKLTKKYEKLLEQPETDPIYLAIDKMQYLAE